MGKVSHRASRKNRKKIAVDTKTPEERQFLKK